MTDDLGLVSRIRRDRIATPHGAQSGDCIAFSRSVSNMFSR